MKLTDYTYNKREALEFYLFLFFFFFKIFFLTFCFLVLVWVKCNLVKEILTIVNTSIGFVFSWGVFLSLLLLFFFYFVGIKVCVEWNF